eukprot:754104-Hanusia_phi.AAC.1
MRFIPNDPTVSHISTSLPLLSSSLSVCSLPDMVQVLANYGHLLYDAKQDKAGAEAMFKRALQVPHPPPFLPPSFPHLTSHSD